MKVAPPPFPVVAPPPTGKSAPPVTPPAAVEPAPLPAKPKAKGRLVLIGGAVAALLLIGGGFFAWQTFMATPPPPPPKPAPKQKAAPATAEAPAAGTATTVPGKAVEKAKEAVAARAASGQTDLPDDDATKVGSSAAAPKGPAVSGPSTGVARVSPGISATTAVDAVPDATPAFRSFVANVKISGVVGGGASRTAAALINGRLTRAGDVVDRELGITFQGVDVEKKQVIFKDKSGATVARRY